MRMLKTKIKLYKDCSSEDRVEMEEGVSRLRMELNYVEHYPDKLKYQALYPTTETTSANAIARRKSLLASTAERVANGELVDVSLEFCSGTPLEGKGFEHVAELAKLMKGDVVLEEEKVLEENKRKKKKTYDKPLRKAAPVDEEPDSDWEMDSSKHLSKDDFFLDTTGNSDDTLKL